MSLFLKLEFEKSNGNKCRTNDSVFIVRVKSKGRRIYFSLNLICGKILCKFNGNRNTRLKRGVIDPEETSLRSGLGSQIRNEDTYCDGALMLCGFSFG